MESFKERLAHFVNNSPNEILLTIPNSITVFTLDELKAANDQRHDSLMFIGAHAVMQTVGEKIFGEQGVAATRFYLEHFVDGQTQDRKFSLIASKLHEMRNVKRHLWPAS